MKTHYVFSALVVSLLFISCKHQENANEKKQTVTTNETMQMKIVSQFIAYKQTKSVNKNESQFIAADSLPYYLQILSNALVSDIDTALINLEDFSVTTSILPAQNAQYAYSYVYYKTLELRDSILNKLPAQKKVYNIEPFVMSNNGILTCKVLYGEPHITAPYLGKATNPSTGLNYFASTDQYRFGYGNEIIDVNNHLVGGKPNYGETKEEGNGLIEEAWGKYVWYGGSVNNALPTTMSQKYAGAAKMLETYGQNNIFATYGWPAAAPTGYKYLYTIKPAISGYIKLCDYRETFTKSNSWYDPNLITNRSNQLFPSLVAAKFCVTGDQLMTNYHVPANPTWSVWQPVWLNATQLNYYLNQIPSIYNYIVIHNSDLNNKVLYRFDVVPVFEGGTEVNCDARNCDAGLFYSSNQWFTPFDLNYFPDNCIKVRYKHKYRFIFAERTLVPDPNAIRF